MAGSGAPLLKDFVDGALVEALGDRFRVVHPGFDRSGFVTAVEPELGDLELKERIALIARSLAERLPPAFPDAADVVVAAAGSGSAPSGWEAWPLATFIELFGVDHPAEALDAMETVTRFASCEFALRPQLADHPEETFARLAEWVDNGDDAVRRLVSEGTRPLLPWGKRVPALREDPRRGLALVERLRADRSEAVRRSVANHLNDVSKDHPELAVETAARWAEDGTPEIGALLRHGLRTLVKRGDPAAMRVLGFTTDAQVEVAEFACEPAEIAIGERVELRATLRSCAREAQYVVVDCVVHFVKSDGAASPKVFKWAALDLAPGEEKQLVRRQWFRDMSTRTHHLGEQTIVLQVAGREAARTSVRLRR